MLCEGFVLTKLTYVTHYLPNSSRRTGGEQRIHATLQALKILSKEIEVNVVTPSWGFGTFNSSRWGMRFTRIGVSQGTRSLAMEAGKLFGPNPFDMASTLLLPFDCSFREELKRLVSNENVLFSHAFSYSWLEDWPRFHLDAHNIEANLRMTFNATNPKISMSDQTQCISKVEESCFQSAHSISVTSQEDLSCLPKITDDKYSVIPNGFLFHPRAVSLKLADPKVNSKKVLFVGSAHPPNIVAVEMILKIAAMNPDFEFHLVGSSVAGLVNTPIPKNIKIYPSVSERKLGHLYSVTGISLVPLNSGSGSSIKTIEALGHNHVLVGSDLAFRGINSDLLSTCLISKHTAEEYSSALQHGVIVYENEQLLVREVGEYVRRNFEWSEISKKLLNQIYSMVGRA
jgi:hypothetical protein